MLENRQDEEVPKENHVVEAGVEVLEEQRRDLVFESTVLVDEIPTLSKIEGEYSPGVSESVRAAGHSALWLLAGRWIL